MLEKVQKEKNASSRFRKLLPIVVPCMAVVAVALVGGFVTLENKLTDLRFRMIEREATNDLVVVTIDPPSFQELNVWPWPRTYHARLVDNLLAAGARRVAFDVEFSAETTEEGDADFERSLREAAGRVVLPVFKQLHRGPGGNEYVLTEPLPRFKKYVQLASINVYPESDSLVRRVEVAHDWNGQKIPSLSALFANKFRVPFSSFYIDFGISPNSIPRISYADALAGRFDPALVAGKQVVVGATALQLQDYFPVPVHVSMSGVFLHALAYQSLIQDRAMQRVGTIPVLAIALLIAFIVGPRFASWSWKRGLVVAVGLSSGLVLAAAGAQIVWPILVDTMPAIAVVVLVHLAELVSKIDRQSLTLFMQSVTLRRTDNLMRKVVDKSFNGVLTIGANGEIETINAAARSMFGLTEEGIVGTNVAELVPELSANENATGSILATGQHDVTGLRTDGTKFLAELSVNDLEDEEHSRFVAIVRDISEQKRY